MARFRCPECTCEFTPEGRPRGGGLRCPDCGSAVRDREAAKIPERGEESKPSKDVEAAPKKPAAREDREQDRYVRIKAGEVRRGFRIDQMIGAGAMAVVYKATQLSLSRPVALKLLPKKYARNPTFVELFDSETAVMASLNHPHIVSIIDRGHEDESYFFAMEFVDGTTLRDLMRSGRISTEFFMSIARQCGQALKYAHSKGIIHRDIKPANIMLDDQSNVKIADFGVAGIIARGEEERNRKRRVVGTAGYMAPEQRIDVARTDERSDIFSLGVVMYQMLTRRRPMQLPPPPPSQLAEGVDLRLDSLVLKCLKEKPSERFQNAAQFLEALDACQREMTRVGEVCPQCKSENPVTEKTCLKCGADLSGLFDLCPECGAENRRDVGICIRCGENLNKARERISVMISKRRERAQALVAANRHGEAIAQLEEILKVKGRLYGRARAQAAKTIERYAAERRAHYDQVLQQGRTLAADGNLAEAVETWKAIPADVPAGDGARALVAETEGKMSRCQADAQKALDLLGRHQYEKATALLDALAAAWPRCPGLADAQYQLQAHRQTDEMIEFELREVDRLLAKQDYAGAREALAFASSSMPDNPKVQRKLREIGQREKRGRSQNLANEAESLEQEGLYLPAALKWQEAAGLLNDSDDRKALLLRKAAAARAQGGAEESAEELLVKGAPKARPAIKVRRRARPARKRVAMYVLAALLAAALLVAGVVAIYKLGSSREGEDGAARSSVGEAERESKRTGPQPQDTEQDVTPAPSRYFFEDFDDGTAQRWDFPQGDWRVSKTGKRMLRAIADGGEAVALHKAYNEADCGVGAWVELDADDMGPAEERPVVALSIRRREGSEIVLEIKRDGAVYGARLRALVDGRPISETDALLIPRGAAVPLKAKLRLDASGGVVTARVDGRTVGVLKDLPPELSRSGRVALTCRYCRARWDDVVLDRPHESNLPRTGAAPPEPEPTGPELGPIAEAKAAPGTSALSLRDYTLQVTQTFDSTDAGWLAASGSWRRSADGRYRLSGAGGGASFFGLGEFGTVEVTCKVAPGEPGRGTEGKRFGVFARYLDAENYIFFGIAGVGKEGWAPQLVACREGRREVLTVPGGPYRLAREELQLTLAVVGDSACGYLQGRPVLSLDNLADVAPEFGKVGIGATDLGASFDELRVRVAGAVGLDVPSGVEAEVVAPPAVVRLKECGVNYVFIKDLVARDCSMSVLAELHDLRRYPAFALCGAAKGQRDVKVALLLDFDEQGKARLRLSGTLPLKGELQSGIYASRDGLQLDLSQPVKFSLALRGSGLECAVNGVRLSFRGEAASLPFQPGQWGFRSTGAAATIKRVDIRL